MIGNRKILGRPVYYGQVGDAIVHMDWHGLTFARIDSVRRHGVLVGEEFYRHGDYRQLVRPRKISDGED